MTRAEAKPDFAASGCLLHENFMFSANKMFKAAGYGKLEQIGVTGAQIDCRSGPKRSRGEYHFHKLSVHPEQSSPKHIDYLDRALAREDLTSG